MSGCQAIGLWPILSQFKTRWAATSIFQAIVWMDQLKFPASSLHGPILAIISYSCSSQKPQSLTPLCKNGYGSLTQLSIAIGRHAWSSTSPLTLGVTAMAQRNSPNPFMALLSFLQSASGSKPGYGWTVACKIGRNWSYQRISLSKLTIFPAGIKAPIRSSSIGS